MALVQRRQVLLAVALDPVSYEGGEDGDDGGGRALERSDVDDGDIPPSAAESLVQLVDEPCPTTATSAARSPSWPAPSRTLCGTGSNSPTGCFQGERVRARLARIRAGQRRDRDGAGPTSGVPGT